MSTKISLREIAAQPPGPFIIWDSKVRGLCVRRQFSETITYSIIFRNQFGYQKWFKLGRHGILTPTLAREAARQILLNIAQGKDPSAERKEKRHGATVADLCDAYEIDVEARYNNGNGNKLTTIKVNHSHIKVHIKPKLGKVRASALTQEMIEGFMYELPTGNKKVIVSLLGAIFSWAIKKKLATHNPVTGIEKPKDVVKLRRLSDVEYQQLWRGCRARLLHLVTRKLEPA